jgi:hypothetical protein
MAFSVARRFLKVLRDCIAAHFSPANSGHFISRGIRQKKIVVHAGDAGETIYWSSAALFELPFFATIKLSSTLNSRSTPK